MPRVTLEPIDDGNREAVLALRVRPEQQRFVAPNAISLKEASARPEAWLRAICADGRPVGLLMLHDELLRPDPERNDFYFLWRLMIDASQQRRGYGRAALDRLVEHVRRRPSAHTLWTSCVPGPGSPEPFYVRFGFRPTGRLIEGETELELPLADPGV